MKRLLCSLGIWFGVVLVGTGINRHPTQARQDDLKFIRIQMMDSDNGWAILSVNRGEMQVLHSQDGARTWLDISPPTEQAWLLPYATEFFFYDAIHAWVFYPPELWHSQDGGQTWTLISERDYLGTSYYELQFVDEARGWLLAKDCCAAGNEFVQLYTTYDAGASWQLINADEDTNNSADINHDLTTSYHSGMDFADSARGWMALSSIADFGGLLQTDDGGYAWQHVQLPRPDDIPAGETNLACNFYHGQAFSSDSFSVLANCRNASWSGYTPYLYVTVDGGESWQIHDLPITITGNYSPFAFEMISPELAWVSQEINPDDEITIFQSQDGGQTWTAVSSIAMSSENVVLNFVDEHTGWTIDRDGDLLSTTDGGQTWSLVHPQLAD